MSWNELWGPLCSLLLWQHPLLEVLLRALLGRCTRCSRHPESPMFHQGEWRQTAGHQPLPLTATYGAQGIPVGCSDKLQALTLCPPPPPPSPLPPNSPSCVVGLAIGIRPNLRQELIYCIYISDFCIIKKYYFVGLFSSQYYNICIFCT